MIRFSSDYIMGAHPEILQALTQSNTQQFAGYGEDALCEQASQLIRQKCNSPNAAVHLVPGGTQANLLIISAALRPHQAAIAADSGHISVHETGAIEATGHKVIQLPSTDGKLTATQVSAAVLSHKNDPTHEHMPQPKLCYISQPTESGTLYSIEELTALSATCRENGLLLYVDGARLGYGLCAPSNTVNMPQLAQLCDAFTIGGTKVGALFGEAIIINNPALASDFRYIMKQRGALLAKGWLLGLQFCTLMQNNLYERGAQHAINLAQQLAAGLKKHNLPMFAPAATNQIFPILPNHAIDALLKSYVFERWGAIDEHHTAVRFCTAWSTTQEQVDALLADIALIFSKV